MVLDLETADGTETYSRHVTVYAGYDSPADFPAGTLAVSSTDVITQANEYTDITIVGGTAPFTVVGSFSAYIPEALDATDPIVFQDADTEQFVNGTTVNTTEPTPDQTLTFRVHGLRPGLGDMTITDADGNITTVSVDVKEKHLYIPLGESYTMTNNGPFSIMDIAQTDGTSALVEVVDGETVTITATEVGKTELGLQMAADDTTVE